MADRSLKVIFCGTTDESRSRSWGKTNAFLLDQLKKNATVIGEIDYGINNRILVFLHRIYCRIFLGQDSFRDSFLNFMMERKFILNYRKFFQKPDVFIHSGKICIPESLENEAIHVLFSDATIMGGIRYNGLKITRRHWKVLTRNNRKYDRRLNLIFTFNEWTRESLINDFSVMPGKVFNMGFGANLEPYNGQKDYNNGLILTVLRRGLEKNKGLFMLLEGFKLARKKNGHLKLAVVGTTLEPMEGVEYYEGFPREKTIELFRKASLFALPATFEPNGMVYPEALASKTPILGLNRLAFPEFSGYGKYGFITEPEPGKIAEAILDAMSDPRKLQKMAAEGQKFAVERYTWNNVVRRSLRTVEEHLQNLSATVEGKS